MRIRALVLVLLIASTAEAAPIKGAGATSCGVWIEDRKHENNAFLTTLSWIQGFISAYNHYVYSGKNPKGVFGSIDHNAIAVWIDNYCQQNPLSSPYEGSVLLVRELELRAN